MIADLGVLSRRLVAVSAVLAGMLAPVLPAGPAGAQTTQPASVAKTQTASAAHREAGSVPALLLSDIHFDPFHDPGKVKELAAAPVSEWRAILSAALSADQVQAFAQIQETCHARGVDTPFVLLRSSLQAMRARQPDAKFITVSGDLIAHGFPCRYADSLSECCAGGLSGFRCEDDGVCDGGTSRVVSGHAGLRGAGQ